MKRLLFLLCLIPGLVWAGMALNPAVSSDTIAQTICVSGWTKKVRPGVRYTNYVKQQYLREAGLPTDVATMREYELDHIVPLELGGHPYNEANLQLQLWDGPNGAHAKDAVETFLHRAVCAGKVSLPAAQACIYNNWQQCRQLVIEGALK